MFVILFPYSSSIPLDWNQVFYCSQAILGQTSKPTNFSRLFGQEAQYLSLSPIDYRHDIQQQRDWYFVSIKHFCREGGRGLLGRYGGSLFRLLQSVYPEDSWKSYSHRRPHHMVRGKSYYSKAQHLLYQYVQKVSEYWSDFVDLAVGIYSDEKLYWISNGNSIQLFIIVKNDCKFHKNRLLQFIRQIFPKHSIEINFVLQFSEADEKRRQRREFDVSTCSHSSLHPQIFIPDLSLAFEYNGEYHYHFVAVYPMIIVSLLQVTMIQYLWNDEITWSKFWVLSMASHWLRFLFGGTRK